MLTGPPPKFHGTRDILPQDHLRDQRDRVAQRSLPPRVPARGHFPNDTVALTWLNLVTRVTQSAGSATGR